MDEEAECQKSLVIVVGHIGGTWIQTRSSSSHGSYFPRAFGGDSAPIHAHHGSGPPPSTLQFQRCQSLALGVSLVKQNGLQTGIKESNTPVSCKNWCRHMCWAIVSSSVKRSHGLPHREGMRSKWDQGWEWDPKSCNAKYTFEGELFNAKACSFPNKEKFAERERKVNCHHHVLTVVIGPVICDAILKPPPSPLLQEKEIIFNYSITLV